MLKKKKNNKVGTANFYNHHLKSKKFCDSPERFITTLNLLFLLHEHEWYKNNTTIRPVNKNRINKTTTLNNSLFFILVAGPE